MRRFWKFAVRGATPAPAPVGREQESEAAADTHSPQLDSLKGRKNAHVTTLDSLPRRQVVGVGIWHLQRESTEPSCPVLTGPTDRLTAGGGGGLMDSLTADLSIVADHVHPLMSTVFLMANSSGIMRRVASRRFHEHNVVPGI